MWTDIYFYMFVKNCNNYTKNIRGLCIKHSCWDNQASRIRTPDRSTVKQNTAQVTAVITHTTPQTQMPTLLDSWGTNMPFVKMLCKKTAHLSVGPLMICQVFSVFCKTVYSWVMTNCCVICKFGCWALVTSSVGTVQLSQWWSAWEGSVSRLTYRSSNGNGKCNYKEGLEETAWKQAVRTQGKEYSQCISFKTILGH